MENKKLEKFIEKFKFEKNGFYGYRPNLDRNKVGFYIYKKINNRPLAKPQSFNSKL